jgi:hypothetical protein
MRRVLLVLGLALVVPAPASAWKPGPPQYDVGVRMNVPVTMSDGTVLRADVYYPTDPATGEHAKGDFPVLMVQTPYGKNIVGSSSGDEGSREAGTQTGPLPYLIKRGYIDVVAEVRGTGASQGSFDLLDPVQSRDGAELVSWAAKLPHSSGKVGLYGPSYMGIMQFKTVTALGRDSPVKAIFPIVAANSVYRDLAFSGGMPGIEFDLAFIGLMVALNTAGPFENPGDAESLLAAQLQHAQGLPSWQAYQTANIATGGDQAYDEAYWQARAPRDMLAKVVANGIPAFLIGGWFDVFQRGEPLNYSGLQNAFRGRPVTEPMRARQRATGRYQLLQGPWYHVAAGTGVSIYPLELAWFDRWLKGERTGIDETSRPLHVFALGTRRWLDTSHWPPKEASPQRYYLAEGPSGSGAPSQNDGLLVPEKPAAASGADQVGYLGASSPCSLQTDQFGAGVPNLIFEAGQLPPNPCTEDDRTIQSGPGALTYTTAAMERDTVIGGPIGATIFATSTRPDVELIATLEDVHPDGRSTPFTSGALLGSHRALDSGLSWFAPDGGPLLPYHPYTKAAVTPVPVGEVTRFDIEVFSTFAQLRKGHRLRFTLTTSDTPHVLPSAADAANLAGGVYQVQRGSANASFLTLSTAPAEAFGHCFEFTPAVEGERSVDCRPAGVQRPCLARRSPIGPRNIGRVRLGLTRRRLLALRLRSPRRTRRTLRWCVKRSRGRVTAVLSPRGRARLVVTTAPAHGNRRVRPGGRVSALGAYPGRVSLGGGLYRATPRSPRLIGIRGGRVQFIAVADRGLLRSPRALRRYLRLAKG